MRLLRMTRGLAWWAARDAGSRNARQHGRLVWNEADLAVCAAEFERLWPDDVGDQVLMFLKNPQVSA